MIKCGNCELVYCDPLPIPAQIADHYDMDTGDYFPEREPQHMFHFDRVRPMVMPVKPGMTALDIGAGAGGTMKRLSDEGWDAWGIEPSPSFARAAVERSGVPKDRIRVSALEDAQFDQGSFDLINLGAVLEHLYSPSQAIEKVLPWLKPGGLVHVEVPSSGYFVSKMINLYYKLRGVNYVTHLSPMHPPYHLYEFTHRSFFENARRVGYEVASYEYWTNRVYSVPRVLHRPLLKWMERTGSGMQLTIWLGRTAAN